VIRTVRLPCTGPPATEAVRKVSCDCRGDVYLWDTRTRELADFFLAPANYTHPGGWIPGEVRFFRGGKLAFSFIAPSDGDSFHIWDIETGEMAFTGDEEVASFMGRFPPDPAFEEWCQNQPRRDPESCPTEAETFLISRTGGNVRMTIPLNDGSALTLVEFEKPGQAVFRTDIAKKSIRKLFGTDGIPWIRSWGLSGKKDRIVTGGLNGAIAVWDARTGRRLLAWVGHQGHVRAVSFADDDSTIISGCDTGHDPSVFPPQLKIWDSTTGRLISRFRTTLSAE
jgi:WD40 repeat protein